MTRRPPVSGRELPHLEAADPLRRVLDRALADRGVAAAPAAGGPPPWSAGFFGLDRCRRFREAGEEIQDAVLRTCAGELLREAAFVERAGVGYMSAMALSAASVEERQLYGMFAADEATHLARLGPWLDPAAGSDDAGQDAFLRFLSDLLESAEPVVLLFVVQVVLEGWGITHYGALARGCRDPQLSAVFHGFLKDEARHHGSGLELFERSEVSREGRAAMVLAMHEFLSMVRVGPQRVVGALSEAVGGLSRAERIDVLTELGGEAHARERLALLRSLMRGEGAAPVVAELEARGDFEPAPMEACA